MEQILIIFGDPVEGEPRGITAGLQITLEAMCQTLVVVLTQADSLIQTVLYEGAAKNHVCMTSKNIMNVYLGISSYINIGIAENGNINLPTHRKAG